MHYFEIINCTHEPFPKDPQEGLFFPVSSHEDCLNKLLSSANNHQKALISLVGDEGTGKTTILNEFKKDLIKQNPTVKIITLTKSWFASKTNFLRKIAKLFNVKLDSIGTIDDLEFSFKNAISASHQENKDKLVLCIDRAENIPFYCFEVIDNIFKNSINAGTMQIFLFAKPQIIEKINQYPSLAQNHLSIILPEKLSFSEIKGLIDYYLQQANSDHTISSLFTGAGRYYAYLLSKGNPGKALELIHLTILFQVLEDQARAGIVLCHKAAKNLLPEQAQKFKILNTATAATIFTLFIASLLNNYYFGPAPQLADNKQIKPISAPAETKNEVGHESKTAEPKPPATATQKEVIEEEVAEVEKTVAPSTEIDNLAADSSENIEIDEQADLVENLIEKIIATPPEVNPTPMKESKDQEIKTAQIASSSPRIEPEQNIEKREEDNVTTSKTIEISGEEKTAPAEDEVTEEIETKSAEIKDTSAVKKERQVSPEKLAIAKQAPESKTPPAETKETQIDRTKATITPKVIVAGSTKVAVKEDKKEALQSPITIGAKEIKTRVAKTVLQSEFLGQLQISKNSTLGHMIRGVYGRNTVTKKNISWLLSKNPHIKNPNRIKPGTVINFPPKAVRIPSGSPSGWWINIYNTETLKDAYRFLRSKTPDKPWLLIIPDSNDPPKKYSIFVEQYFSKEESARKHMKNLKQKGFKNISLIKGMDLAKYYFEEKN